MQIATNKLVIASVLVVLLSAVNAEPQSIQGTYEIIGGGPGCAAGGQGWGGLYLGKFHLSVADGTIDLEPLDIATDPLGYEWTFPSYPATQTTNGFTGSEPVCEGVWENDFTGEFGENGILSIYGHAYDCDGSGCQPYSFGFVARQIGEPIPTTGFFGRLLFVFFVGAIGYGLFGKCSSS